MKFKLMTILMVAGGSLFAQSRFSVGVQFGTPGYYSAPPVVAAAYRPPCPGPGYVWIDGYDGDNGYWSLPPYEGAYWVAPRNYGGRFVAGYWGGARYYGGGERFRERREPQFRERGERFERGRQFDRGREVRRDFHR